MESTHEIFQRSLFPCVVHDDRFIIMTGGMEVKAKRVKSTVIYDSKLQSYTSLSGIPLEKSCGAAIIKEYLYVVSTDRICRLSLSFTSPWERLLFRDKCSAVNTVLSKDAFLYIFNINGTNEIYDTRRDKFLTMPKMNTPRLGFASAIVDDKFYIIGGYDYSSFKMLCSVEVFNTSTHSWSKATSLPQPLGSAAAAVTGTSIVVTGGEYDIYDLSPHTYIFDLNTQRWAQSYYQLSPPRKNHCCVTLGEQILTIGGRDKEDRFCSADSVDCKYLVSSHVLRS